MERCRSASSPATGTPSAVRATLALRARGDGVPPTADALKEGDAALEVPAEDAREDVGGAGWRAEEGREVGVARRRTRSTTSSFHAGTLAYLRSSRSRSARGRAANETEGAVSPSRQGAQGRGDPATAGPSEAAGPSFWAPSF